MARLSELRRGAGLGQHRQHSLTSSGVGGEGGGQSVGFNFEPGTIRNSMSYPRPIDALFEGQAVTVLASGDIQGMSPALQICDENGQVDWVSSDEVTITDRATVPQGETQRNRLRKNSQNQQQGAYSGN